MSNFEDELPSKPPAPKLRRKPFLEGRQRIERKAATLQEERDEVVALINAHIDKGIAAADNLMVLDKDKFFKLYKDVSQQLEACMDKLLCIKAQLVDEEEDGAGRSSRTVGARSRSTSRQGRVLGHSIASTLVASDVKPSLDKRFSEEEKALIARIKSQGLKKDSLVTSSIESFEANESLIKEIMRIQSNQVEDQAASGPLDHPSSEPSLQQVDSPCPGDHEAGSSQVPLKSISNQDFIFRSEKKTRGELAFGLDDHSSDNRLSLPEPLSPPLDGSGQIGRPRPSLVRTPELAMLARHQQDSGLRTEEVGHTTSTLTEQKQRSEQDIGSEAQSPTGTVGDEHYDTASSEIYLSQEAISDPTSTKKIEPPVAQSRPPPPNFSSIEPPHRQPPSAELAGQLHVPLNCHVSVRISHINTPGDFFVHINRDQVNGLFNEVQYSQEKYITNLDSSAISAALVGSLYATRYSSDISWYRVEVVDVTPNLTKPIEVLFIDYGYTGKLTLADLHPLCPNLSSKPAHAVHCALRGVDGQSGTWSLKAIEEFKNSVSFYSIRGMFHEPVRKRPGKATFPTDLYLDWGSEEMNNVLLYLSPTEFVTTDPSKKSKSRSPPPKKAAIVAQPTNQANQPLIRPFQLQPIPQHVKKEQKPVPVPVPAEAPQPVTPNRAEKEKNSENKKSPTEALVAQTVEAPRVPAKEYLPTVISHVVSPSEFYIHIITSDGEDEASESGSQLDDLRENLNEHFGKEANLVPTVGPSTSGLDISRLLGTFWGAMYPNDSSWYRVRVLDIVNEETALIETVAGESSRGAKCSKPNQVMVQYIDFGNVEIVHIDDLRPLTSELASVPALAVKCALANVHSEQDSWCEEALRVFEELSGFEQETVVTAHVLSRPTKSDFEGSLSVLLWNSPDDPEAGDILINAVLVREGLAATESFDWVEEAEKSCGLQDRVATTRRSEDKDIEEEDEAEEEETEDEDELQGFPIDRLPVDSIVLLRVTCAESPDSFYGVLPYGLETLDETGAESLVELIDKADSAPHALHFRSLREDLSLKYGNCRRRSSEEGFFGLGTLVAVQDADMGILRGRVVGLIVEEGLYRVQCLDSGLYRLVPRSGVFPLGVEFCALPAYAVKCALANIEPLSGPEGQWSIEAIHTFKEYTEGKSFAAHVIATDRGILCAELLGLEEDNSVSVVEFLVSLGLARDPLPAALSPAEVPIAHDQPFLASAAAAVAASNQSQPPAVAPPPAPRSQLAGATNQPDTLPCGQYQNFGYVDEDDKSLPSDAE